MSFQKLKDSIYFMYLKLRNMQNNIFKLWCQKAFVFIINYIMLQISVSKTVWKTVASKFCLWLDSRSTQTVSCKFWKHLPFPTNVFMDDNTVSITTKDLVHPIAFLLSTMSMALPCGFHTCGWCTSTFCPGSTSCHSWSGRPTSCEPQETESHDLIFLISHLDHSEVAISFATSVKGLATPYAWPSLNFSLFGVSS